MSATSARDVLIAAVRRDLWGQDGPDDTVWPGSTPRVVDSLPGGASVFAAWRDVVGPLVDADGHEVLHGSPLRRYGIGVLYPGLSRGLEQQLDAVQAEPEGASGTDPPENTEPPLQPAEPDRAPAGPADVDDAAEEPGTAGRPRSMAVSFLVAPGTADLELRVTGGRYEPLTLTVGGQPAQFWRRRPVELVLPLPVSGTTFRRQLDGGGRRQLDGGGRLQVSVGATYRRHHAGTIVTAFVQNTSSGGTDLADATVTAFFQARLEVRSGPGVVLDYPAAEIGDIEDRSLDLLYHRHPVRAVGHGCNAACVEGAEGSTVVGDHFPVEVVRSPIPDAVDDEGRVLAVDMDALGRWDIDAMAEVDAVFDAYGRWIERHRAEIPALAVRHQSTALAHLDACVEFLSDARRGWQHAHDDLGVRQVLRWTSAAMADQRRAYAASSRPLILGHGGVTGADGHSPHAPGHRAPARWRAFQVAFLLAYVGTVVEPEHPRRDAVDIIWLPTGGGKTEAYSAAAAFTMLWRRTHEVVAGAVPGLGCTVLMRYTLRLLTAQQLQRAAALICALEQIRAAHTDLLGSRRFTIGSWLGRRSTPNDWVGAKKALKDWANAAESRGFLLTRCPWCAAEIGRRPGSGNQAIYGYQLQTLRDGRSRVMAYCPDPTCAFNPGRQQAGGEKALGLPVFEVDEDLYTQPPTFVVGTIDKFAMLSWRAEPAALFGLAGGERQAAGPDLFIQDELHLISGPLGSLDALYEPVLSDLCERAGGNKPRIIAATATTRRYAEQTRALYGRDQARLVPPPGLDATDNFFARSVPDSPGKIFVGVCAPGFGRVQESQVRVLAALSHAAGSLDASGVRADPWWTNLCFFSSRRVLGLAQSLCQTHLRGHTWRLHRATGVYAGAPRSTTGTRTAQRHMQGRVELTAHATGDVSESMDRLAITHPERGCIDLCFATSMIEVGIDIDRLGLLTMFGQPKSASQYIQVAGRIGRDEKHAPGVVFVLLSPYNSRDRSHFEQFSSFHRRLYASVEPVSITPFTPAALDRGLAGALSAWVRQATAAGSPQAALGALKEALVPIAKRARNGSEESNLRRRFDELEALLAATTHSSWGILRPNRPPDGFLRALGDDPAAPADSADAMNTTWSVPTSMRSVDTEAGARSIERIRPTGVPESASARAVRDEDLF